MQIRELLLRLVTPLLKLQQLPKGRSQINLQLPVRLRVHPQSLVVALLPMLAPRQRLLRRLPVARSMIPQRLLVQVPRVLSSIQLK